MPKRLEEHLAPHSICTCGHTGDGPDSDHSSSRLVLGHGRCTVPGCQCQQFTWRAWTPEFQEKINEAMEKK